MQALLDRAPPMYMAASDRTLTFTNPAFDRIVGVNPSGVQAVLARIFDRLDAGEKEVVVRQEYDLPGGQRHFRSTHFRTGDGDTQAGFAGVYADVTLETQAMRQSSWSESRFRDVIRSTSDWVWETDANLNLTYVSERITEALELPPTALNGRYLFALGEFAPTSDGAPTRPDLAAELTPFRGRSFLMADSHGQMRRIALSGVPVFDETTGKFAGYRGTGTDVTSQHEAEQRAKRSQRELEASLRELRDRNLQLDLALSEARSAVVAKTEFLGKMSHELRTPLNAIIGFAEMSVQQVFGSMNERYLSYFRDIRSAAHHLLHIINDILDAVHIESSEVSISPRPTRLREIIDEARSIIAVRAEQQSIDIDGVGNIDDWLVMADPGRARQIFVNLLNNAVKFTENGGRIGVDVTRGEDDLLHVTVWDTGVGIAEDELDRIFESFHQVGSDIMKKPREGTGLGLTISRQLARLMGGDIVAESHLGQGSRFTVKLPVALQLAEAGE